MAMWGWCFLGAAGFAATVVLNLVCNISGPKLSTDKFNHLKRDQYAYPKEE
eukprot:CAMPEP_0197647890 /NCGR_PEP_ID=MMETSP1338-20131121/26806_1 /TAXON_ID=43686 ORGANISM="Pelagodinium beii, Strain RCC1491" /NCGR_SAMPLE_ID=MMETSP1338 /ASSEMBLY_ACC=CAM_ASM_000754 /LENGTH=50 /DNA_ID=CAMNT_0043221781 /DNA_START=1 /DNA_END=153 /DNA_ORIENTATION=-